MTSLALVLVEVPEPVWTTSIGNCSSYSPAAISAAARSMREAVRFGSSPSSALTAAAAPFRRASQCTTATGTVSPEIWKLSTALAVSGPHNCCLLGIRSPLWLRASETLSAERRQLTREPHGVVVGHQKSRALEYPQLAVGQQRERLLSRQQRVQRVLVGPQQEHRHVQLGVQLEQVGLRPARPRP